MRKFLKILILTFLGAVTITSCSDDSDGIPGWPWNDNSTEKPDEPDVAEACPIDGPFDHWTAQFFLEIRQDSCEKIACQRPKIPRRWTHRQFSNKP